MKKNPDPFDDRHPSRIDPSCVLGQLYKVLFRKDLLMSTVNNALLYIEIVNIINVYIYMCVFKSFLVSS